MSLSSHQSAKNKNDEWLTPPDIIRELGPFNLDPCSPVVRPWDTAAVHYNRFDDGLSIVWAGFVWCNPPFGGAANEWLDKMANHQNGIALIPARTETRMFFDHVWEKATCILFLKGRPHFHLVDGSRANFNSGAPICLIGYGVAAARRLSATNLAGKLIMLAEVEK